MRLPNACKCTELRPANARKCTEPSCKGTSKQRLECAGREWEAPVKCVSSAAKTRVTAIPLIGGSRTIRDPHVKGKNWCHSPEKSNSSYNGRFFRPIWPWNLIEDHGKQEGNSSMQFSCIVSKPSVTSNWSYSQKTPNRVKIDDICSLWPWNLTDDFEKQRALLPCHIKLCASFHCHICIQTVVTDRKLLNWILISVTLTLGLWSWPCAWTSVNIYNPCKFHDSTMMGTSQKGVTESRETDRRTVGRMDGLNHS